MWRNIGPKNKLSNVLQETQFHNQYEPRPDYYQPYGYNQWQAQPRQPSVWLNEHSYQSYNYNNSNQSHSYYSTNLYPNNFINYAYRFCAYQTTNQFRSNYNTTIKYATRKKKKKTRKRKAGPPLKKARLDLAPQNEASRAWPFHSADPVSTDSQNAVPVPTNSQNANPLSSDSQKELSVTYSQSKIRKKLLILGDEGCGKTCLLVVFSKDQFSEEHDRKMFTGHVDMEVNGKLVQLELCDTSSHRNFDHLRTVSYSGTDVILMCFSIDSTESLEHILGKWTPEVNLNCPNVPIVLVGNKMELREDDATIKKSHEVKKNIVTSCQGLDMAKKINAYAYLECSAKDKKGVREIFDICTRLALQEVYNLQGRWVVRSQDTISPITSTLPNNNSNASAYQNNDLSASCSQIKSLAAATSQNRHVCLHSQRKSPETPASLNASHIAALSHNKCPQASTSLNNDPESSTYQNKSPADSLLQNKSPIYSAFPNNEHMPSHLQSKSHDTSISQNRSPQRSTSMNKEPIASAPQNKNPAHFRLAHATSLNKSPTSQNNSPAAAASRNKNPAAATSLNKSLPHVTSRSKNPVTSTSQKESLVAVDSRNKSPAGASSQNHGPLGSASQNKEPEASASQIKEPGASESQNKDLGAVISRNKDPVTVTSQNKDPVSSKSQNKNTVVSHLQNSTNQSENPIVLIDLDSTVPSSYDITSSFVNAGTTRVPKETVVLPLPTAEEKHNLLSQIENKDTDQEEVTYLFSVDPNEGRLVELVDLSEESQVFEHADKDTISANSYISVKPNSEASDNVICNNSKKGDENDKSYENSKHEEPIECGEACCYMCNKRLKELSNNKCELYMAKCGHLFCMLCIKKENKCIKCKVAITNLRKIISKPLYIM